MKFKKASFNYNDIMRISFFLASILVCIYIFIRFNVSSNLILDNYSKNKDNYNYSIDIDYTGVVDDRIVAGEKIYIDDEEYKLFEKSIPLSLIKKTVRLAFADKDIKESVSFYEAKQSKDETLSKEDTNYKKAKTTSMNEYLEKLDKDKKYLASSHVFSLGEKDGYDYIKEIVYFVNPDNYSIEHGVEIDSKFNYSKDKLEYMSYKDLDDTDKSNINTIVKDSLSIYNKIDSLKSKIVSSIEEKENLAIDKLFIVDEATVVGESSDSKEIIRYNIFK